MRPFLGLPVSQKKRNVRSSRSAKNGSSATECGSRSTPSASGAGVAGSETGPFIGLPVSQKKRNARFSRSAKNGSKAAGSGPIESGVSVAELPVSPKPPAARLTNGSVGGLPVSQKTRNVRSSRSAKNGSKAAGSGPIESGAGVAEWPAAPARPDNKAHHATS